MDSNLKGTKLGHPFLVTGLGGSGTRFLANQFNSSPSWSVLHEPDSVYYINPRPWTGAVDSTVRHCRVVDDYLEENRLWIVVRDPREIAKHCVRKGTWTRVKKEIGRDLERLYSLLEAGAKIIHFSDIRSRLNVNRIQNAIGIRDIPVSHYVNPVGHARRGKKGIEASVAAKEVMQLSIAQSYVEDFVA